MELVIRNVVTFSIVFNCQYDKAFDYLIDPINQKEWAIHFVKEVEQVEDQTIVTLLFGKMPIKILSDKVSGVIDIYMGDGKPTRTRLISIEDNLCIYNFTLAQPKNMPDTLWDKQGIPNMEEELAILKSILESK